MDQPAERQTSCTSSALSFITAFAMQKMTPFAISVRSLVGMIDSSQVSSRHDQRPVHHPITSSHGTVTTMNTTKKIRPKMAPNLQKSADGM